MVRKKVALEFIANDATRRTTFNKRRKGLMKKASDLATLCNVKACVVVYGDGEAQPEVWPSVAEATRILASFKAMPELERYKKKMNQQDFLCQRIGKLQEQINKANRENRERDTTSLLQEALLGRHPGLANITVEDLTSLGLKVKMHLNDIMERIDQLSGQTAAAPAFQSPTDQIQMAATYAAAGNVDYMMREDPMYQALPPQESSWADAVRTSGGNLTDENDNDASSNFSWGDMSLLSSGFSGAVDVAGPSYFPPSM